MFRHIAVSLAIILSSVSPLLLSQKAIAETALTRAVVESLRNQVRLMRQNQSARPARPSDTMTPGDALATASASMAQLRFNDGSLARLGQQVVFKFVPGSRSFRLSNGTALLLIPPGQGRTNVRTPNAAAGIRGSALFVRYNPETDTTIVGALTNSGIEVFNQTASQTQELKAGYMAVIVKDRIQQVYEFDLNNFYRTSELVRGLNLTKTESTPAPDEAIASVQAETAQALKEQSQFTSSEQVIENPSFVQLPPSTSANFPDLDPNVIDDPASSGVQNSGPFKDAEDIRLLLQGQDNRDTVSSPRTDSDNSSNPTGRNTTNNGNNGNNPSNPTNGSTTNNRSNRDNQRNPNNRNTNNNGRNGNNPSNPTDGNTTNNGSNGNNQSNSTDRNNSNNRSNRDNQRNPNNRNTNNNGNNRDN